MKGVRKLQMFWKKNSATILTCVGAAGVVATTATAIKATPKALRLIKEAEAEKGEELTKLEIVKTAGPVYIPTALLGVSTIVCIFGANTLNKRQQASLTSAYALLNNSYKEYKAKVEALYGEDADHEVRASIAKDHYEEDDFDNVAFDDDKVLFYDEFSQRYFESTMVKVIQAEYNVNRLLATEGGAYLNSFYEFLGIDGIPAGKELGWSSGILESMYWANWIEFDHEKVVMDDGLECYILTIGYEPVIDFAYY